MKVFANWRQRRSKQVGAAGSLSLSGATTYDDPPPNLASQLLQPCKQPSARRNTSINISKDMDLPICQCTLQNTFLSIGTFGAELLSEHGGEMSKETIISNIVEKASDGKSARITSPQKRGISEEGTFINEEEISNEGIKEVVTMSKNIGRPNQNVNEPACMQSANCEEEIDYHTIKDDNDQQFLTFLSKELTPIAESSSEDKDVVDDHSMDNIGGSVPFDNGLESLLENLSIKEFLKGLHMHDEVVQRLSNTSDETGAGKSKTAEDDTVGSSGSGSFKGALEVMCPSGTRERIMDSSRSAKGILGSPPFSFNKKDVSGHTNDGFSIDDELNTLLRNMVPEHYPSGGKESPSINNDLNKLGDISMEEFLKGLCMHGEVAQPYDKASGRKSWSVQGKMGSSRSDEERGNSSGSVNGMLSSKARSVNGSDDERIKGLVEKKNKEKYIKQKDKKDEVPMDYGRMRSSSRAKGKLGFSSAKSPDDTGEIKQKGSVPNDDEKDEQSIDMDCETASTLNCLRIVSTNYHMDLKRLILSVTPHYLAKHMLKRLKLAQRQMMDRLDSNYQARYYKQFLHNMFRMKGKNSKKSSVLKTTTRELCHTANELQEDDHEEQIEKMNDTSGCSMQIADNIHNENWISTDDEYVVLELGGDKH